MMFPENMFNFREAPPLGAKRARSEEPRVFSRRQLMRMRNEDLARMIPEAERPELTKKADLTARIMERRALAGVAVSPSPAASSPASPPVTPSETPMVSEDPDMDLESDFESALAIAAGLLADAADAADAARPPFASGPIVQPDVKAGDERTMPNEVTLQVITDGDLKFIDTTEEPSLEKVRSVMPPGAGYSYVWLVLQNAQFRLDFCYHPNETGLAHKLICTMIRASGKRFAYALPCCIVHSAETGAIGLGVDTTHLWAPGRMPEPNSPLTIFASWLEKYAGLCLVCLIPE